MTSTALLDELDACAQEGAIRRLGTAFARFIASLGTTHPCVLLTCVLLSELESSGHTCLALDDLVDHPCARLHLSAERCEQLHALVGEFPDSVDAWKKLLSACPQIYTVGQTDRNQPLVLDDARLYLRRFWCDEQFIATAIGRRTATLRDVDPLRVKQWLQRLFPAADGTDDHDWQKTACAIAARSDLSIITGGPGTGKTYTVARLLALLWAVSAHPERLRIALAAPSGKAAIRLKQSIDKALSGVSQQLKGHVPDLDALVQGLPSASTLHSLLGANPETRSVRHHAENPLAVDVLIVDEASMVHLEMMADLLAALPAHAMLVLLGDKDQLSSVEAGAVLGQLCEGAHDGHYDARTADYVLQACGQKLPASMMTGGSRLAQRTVMLRRSRRFDGPIGQLALEVNGGRPALAQQLLRQAEDHALHWVERASQKDLLDLAANGRPGAQGGYRRYLSLLGERPAVPAPELHAAWVKSVLDAYDEFRILCAVRQGEWGVETINAAVEQRLVQEKLISRHQEWYAGRPVMVTRNDHGMGIYNGDVGVALPDATADARLRVYFQSGDKIVSVLPTRLADIETAFAMTVHKAQGCEFAHTVLALPTEAAPVVVRELVYTGITRASRYFTLLTPAAAVLDDGIRRQTVRGSGLRIFLDRRDEP